MKITPVKNLIDIVKKQSQLNHHKDGSVELSKKLKTVCKRDYVKAKKYLKLFPFKDDSFSSITNESPLIKYDLNKINGIQYGIKVFKNLSMKEIYFIFKNIEAINISRGCSSGCSHCYVNAIPQHFKENSNFINQISKEDFDSLISGVDKLNKRLGFKFIKPFDKTISAFYDSDCIETEMKDKNGKIYDFIDVNESLKNIIGENCFGIFDTSGWYPKNTKLQQRAERFAQYFSKPENSKKYLQMNVSFNPFHGLYEKSLQLKEAGDIEKADKFRNFYTDRMSNTFFTFTPFLDKENFGIITRIKKNLPGRDRLAMDSLKNEVLEKLKKLYIKDFNSDQKYIKKKEEIKKYINIIKNEVETRLEYKFNEISYSTKGDRFFENDYTKKHVFWANADHFKNNIKHHKKMIDSNGKIYVSDEELVAPTDLKLNFKNKDKQTVPPGLFLKNAKFTREFINR